VRALLLLAAVPLFGQVNAQLSPEPMAVLQALRIHTVGLWRLSACNDGPAPVTLAPERFYLAFPSVRIIDPARAAAILSAGQKATPASQAALWIGRGLAVATMLTGFGPIAASKTVTTSLALGVPAAQWAEKEFQGLTTSLAPYNESLLNAPVQLAPGVCASRTVFAAKQKSPQAVEASIK
jgi:hypothetical protein